MLVAWWGGEVFVAGADTAEEIDEPADPEDPDEPEEPGEPQEAEELDAAPVPDRAEEIAGPGTPGPVRLLVLATMSGPGAGVDEVAAAGKRLREALDRLGHVQVLAPGDLGGVPVPARVQEELARVANHADKGRESLLNLDLEQAADSFQSARVLLRKNMHWLDDPDPMIDVLMGLAESLATAGNLEGAKAAYHEVLVISPGYEPDPGQVPSKFRSLFDQVREQVTQELAGSVAVESDPDGATVSLDGLSAGTTPLVKSGVPPGLHMLRVHRDGFAPHRETIEVVGGQTCRREVELAPLPVPRLVRATRRALAEDGGAGPGPGSSADRLARELARRAEVTAVVVSRVCLVAEHPVLTVAVVPRRGEGIHQLGARLDQQDQDEVARALAWRISDALEAPGPAPAPADLGLDFDAHLLGAPRPEPVVVALQPEDQSVAGPVPTEVIRVGETPGEPPPPPPEEHVPIWGKWWFWTGAGALVVGAVVTTLALTLDREVETRYDPDTIHIVLERVLPQ